MVISSSERLPGGGEHRLERAASQVPEDQTGPVGLPPVVVQRHDVRVLQSGDQVGLHLEPSHELGSVGELRTDDLDGHVTTERRLRSPIDDGEGSLPQMLAQAVASQRPAGLRLRQQRGVAGQDAPIEFDQVVPRGQPGLVVEALAVLLEDACRLGLATGAEQGQHSQTDQPVSQGVLLGGLGQTGEGVGVHPRRHHGAVATLDGGHPELVQPVGLGEGPELLGHLLIGRAAPQPQGLVQEGESPMPIELGLLGLVDQLTEALAVDQHQSAVQPEPATLGDHDLVVTQCLTQTTDIGANRATGIVRQLIISPDPVSHSLPGHRPPHVDGQRGQEAPLAWATEVNRLGSDRGPRRTQHLGQPCCSP